MADLKNNPMERFDDLVKPEGLETKAEFGEIFAAISEAIAEGRSLDDFSKARIMLTEAKARAERLTDEADQELKDQVKSLIADYEQVITP